jgi:GPI mannosyltransferase 3
MRHLAANVQAADGKLSVAFLLPCHATPFYSHIHANVSMTFLDCSPPGM